MMTQQTAIEIVKRKLNSATIKYEDISKTTNWDILVEGSHKVIVMFGAPSRISRRGAKVIDTKGADVIAYVGYTAGVPPFIYWLTFAGEKTIATSPRGLFPPRKPVKIKHEKPILRPELWYTPAEISRFGFIDSDRGTCTSAKYIKNLISTKQLKAKIAGKGTQKRYWVRGDWISEYLSK